MLVVMLEKHGKTREESQHMKSQQDHPSAQSFQLFGVHCTDFFLGDDTGLHGTGKLAKSQAKVGIRRLKVEARRSKHYPANPNARSCGKMVWHIQLPCTVGLADRADH